MDMKDIKQGMPGFKRYARSHLSEFFTIAAILIASLSAWKGMFWGTAGWSYLCFAVTMIWGVLIPNQADAILNRAYRMITMHSRVSQILIGVLKIAIAAIIPWFFFAAVGLLAGEAYHYYTKINRDGSHYRNAA